MESSLTVPATLPAAPSATCTRCGTFANAALTLNDQQLCATCVDRTVLANRFWSAKYLKVLGALLNPTAAMVLLAINHSRLGDAKRARQWGIGAAVLGAFYFIVLAANLPIPNSAFMGAGIATGIAVGTAWEATWKVLEPRGAKRANRWAPPLLTLAAFIGLVVVLAVIETAREVTP